MSESPIDPSRLDAATDTLARRGPDGRGTWISADGHVGFGHRRLSILDLSSAGAQPFVVSEAECVLTYNGEVYNFESLRTELVRLGHVFRSRTDTEVVLRAYVEWGPRFVSRLRGMFALAIWDGRRRRLLLARDRVGIKPLHYYDHDGTFAFASELKAFRALPSLDLSIDRSALYDFLTYLYVPAPKTQHRFVRKLPPGHVLLVENGRVRLERYWDLHFADPGAAPRRDAIEGLVHHLQDAVESHLVSDVPVGSLLSGGIDSSAVTAFAQRVSSTPIRTFSAGFDVEEHDETQFARLVAEHLGTSHVETIVPVERARTFAETLGEIYDEPFGDSSAIPTSLVCAIARAEVTVALSGDGGDEIFGGYTWYRRHLRFRRIDALPRPLRRGLLHALLRSRATSLRGVPRVVEGLRDDLERHVAIVGGLTREAKRAVLSPATWRSFEGYDDCWFFRRHWQPALDPLSRLQYLDLHTYLPDDILTKVDRASMWSSLELRPPLLDHPLLEYVASLPVAQRSPGGEPKHSFRRALRGLLPDVVLDRPKKGFSVPMHRWIGSLETRTRDVGALTPSQRWSLSVLDRSGLRSELP